MYSFVPPTHRRVTQEVGPEPSATKQQFKAESDINTILARFKRSGIINYVSKYQGQYGDIPALDYHEAQNVLIRARQMYDDLPAKVRSRFEDPGEFLAWVQNPDNEAELVEAGLKAPKAAAVPPAGESEGGSGGTGA